MECDLGHLLFQVLKAYFCRFQISRIALIATLRRWAGLGLGLLFGCSPSPTQEGPAETVSIRVVATTSLAADLARSVLPEVFVVEGLMGPGTDPHLYKSTQGDLKALREADALVHTGLQLEGKLGQIFEKQRSEKPVSRLSDGIPVSALIKSSGFADGYDPHFWMDPQRWADAAAQLSQDFQKAYPEHAQSIEARFQRYRAELEALDREVETAVAGLPDSARWLVTTHDAFNYFGKRYGIQVRSLQGFSTAADFGVKDVRDLVDFVIAQNIAAVFVENIVSSRSLDAVVEGCRSKGFILNLGSSLYTDALGPTGAEADTYLKMIRVNTRSIVHALQSPSIES